MRGTDHQQSWMFSYISAEKRVPKDHAHSRALATVSGDIAGAIRAEDEVKP
jgi:hypothetical protein